MVILARAGGKLVGVGAKIVTKGLKEVGGENGGTVAVKEGKGGAEGRGGDSRDNSVGDGAPPAGLSLFKGLEEEGVEEQILESRVLVKGLLDIAEELAADDATASPHEGDASIVEIPLLCYSSFPEEHEALGIRNDLGSVEGLLFGRRRRKKIRKKKRGAICWEERGIRA